MVHKSIFKLLYQKRQMLPKKAVLTRLIRANVSFLLYGQKASGKTSKILDLFQENETNYILINCTLANKKTNFLKLFNVELSRYLQSFRHGSSRFKDSSNLDTWITELKRAINQNKKIIEYLDNLYIFMDNIEEMVMSQNFVSAFYTACQKEFPFKFSFVFCGTNFLKKQYALQLPFRTMIAFCMPKPVVEYEKIIRETVEQSLRDHYRSSKVSEQDIETCTNRLTVHIKASFDNVEYNLDKMKSISRAVVEGVTQNLEDKEICKSLQKMINRDELKNIIHQVRQHGPLQQTMMKRKITAIDSEEVYDLNPNLEYYPNLILTSIHLADYYNEKEDKRRFQDYKSRTQGRNKDMKRNDFKIGRHNIHRIMAIADSIESQAKQNEKERVLEHHSLDFYSQFQHLKKINRIKYSNNKITGVVKEEEAKAFMMKNGLKYEQFMST